MVGSRAWVPIPTARAMPRAAPKRQPGSRRVSAELLTTQRRLGAGAVRGEGSRGKYHEVAELEGEPHVIRRDLAGNGSHAAIEPTRSIALISRITDLHVTDVQSPARFEFINREWQDPRFQDLLPMQRPQE